MTLTQNSGKFLAFAAFCLTCAYLTFHGLGDVVAGYLVGNDDYMRLVQIRDWLSGQSTSDLTQYRMNADDPVVMHWSRVTDVFVGGLISLFDVFMSRSQAEIWAVTVWPLSLLAALYTGIYRLSRQISTSPAYMLAVMFLMVFAFQTHMQFVPGRIDHHGLQIVLAVWAAWAMIASRRNPWLMIMAGLFCTLSLYVGMESLPYVLAAIIGAVLIWVFKEDAASIRLTLFGIGLGGSALLWLLLTPGISFRQPACDAYSPAYALAMITIMAAMLGMTRLSSRLSSKVWRFAVAAGFGIAAALVTLVIYPDCAKGPYAALPALLQESWLSSILEAQPIWVVAAQRPIVFVYIILTPLLALLGIAVKLSKLNGWPQDAERTVWIFFGLLLLAGIIQNRVLSFATVFALLIAAEGLVILMSKAQHLKSDIARALAKAAIILLFVPYTATALTQFGLNLTSRQTVDDPETVTTSRKDCFSQEAITALNGLPKGSILNVSDLGAATLKFSDHSIITGPYHRNVSGLMTSISTFRAPSEEAMRRLAGSTFDYVMICDGLSENKNLLETGKDSFLRDLLNERIPDGLTPVFNEEAEPLKIWRVSKAQ